MTVIVETKYGKLSGLQGDAHAAFYGIPYAAPPVLERRWKEPAAPLPWVGVRNATAPGFAAPQAAHQILGFAASGAQSEDCLYLNVFTPAADAAQRPVLFWIHGGGFTHGAGSEDLYNGGPLAQRGDAVVVTINYRLGALGFLALDTLLPGAGVTANAGILDCVAALRWVRDNIAAFGGDPGNVTIFGESAGSAAVGTLLATPAAKGLFHRAIMQSGTGRAATRDHADKAAETMLAELGIDSANPERILEAPVAAIVEAQSRAAAKLMAAGAGAFGPVLDDATVPVSPTSAVREGAAANIPLVIGTNRDEVKLFVGRREPIDDAELVRQVRVSLPKSSASDAAGIVDVYRDSRRGRELPITNLDILDAVNTDVRFRVPSMRLAAAQRDHQPGTYAYLFTYESPARHGALGSCHALELPFVFGTTKAPTQDRFAGSGPDVEGLSRNMMDAWLSFARTSSPGHETIGPWPAYDAATRPTMVFDRASATEADPFAEERAVLEKVM